MTDSKASRKAAKQVAMPEYFEGQRTRYDLMDGFRHLSVPGRAIYVLAALGSGGLLPAAYEYMTYRNSSQAHHDAFTTLRREDFLESFSARPAPADENTPLADLAPGDRFRRLIHEKPQPKELSL